MNQRPSHLASRTIPILSLALIALLFLARLAAGSPGEPEPMADQPVGVTPTPTPTPPPIYLPMLANAWDAWRPPFGVQALTGINPTSLERAGSAGVKWIRTSAPWSAVEPDNTTPANYDWSALDSKVALAAGQDINLILNLCDQPSWAAIYPMGPVTDTADIQEFIGALVERYDGDEIDDAPGSPVVQYFELYNEPDNAHPSAAVRGTAGYWGHNGQGYAELLQLLYPVVHAANPEAKLVLGGIALDWFEEQGGPFDALFLDDVLAACQGHDCFDVMNFHYYPVFRVNWEPYGADVIGKANYVRQKMGEYSITAPVICTEIGWVSGADWGSDELQSRYVVKGFARARAADLGIIIWYALSDSGDYSLPGLLDRNMVPKPSYGAYGAMTAMQDRALYLRALTRAETGSSRLVGYVFHRNGRRIDIVWTEDDTPYDPADDPLLPLTVRVRSVRIVDKHGVEQGWRKDDDDGIVDGRITIEVGGSPLYIEYYP